MSSSSSDAEGRPVTQAVQNLRRGARIQVYWTEEKEWFAGTVQSNEDGDCQLQYDDGTVLTHFLSTERWLPAPHRSTIERRAAMERTASTESEQSASSSPRSDDDGKTASLYASPATRQTPLPGSSKKRKLVAGAAQRRSPGVTAKPPKRARSVLERFASPSKVTKDSAMRARTFVPSSGSGTVAEGTASSRSKRSPGVKRSPGASAATEMARSAVFQSMARNFAPGATAVYSPIKTTQAKRRNEDEGDGNDAIIVDEAWAESLVPVTQRVASGADELGGVRVSER